MAHGHTSALAFKLLPTRLLTTRASSPSTLDVTHLLLSPLAARHVILLLHTFIVTNT